MKLVAIDEHNKAHDLPDAEHVASWIKTNRQSRGMSLANVADRIGVKRQAVWLWENKGSSPTAQNLVKLMGVFIDVPAPSASDAQDSSEPANMDDVDSILGVETTV